MCNYICIYIYTHNIDVEIKEEESIEIGNQFPFTSDFIKFHSIA